MEKCVQEIAALVSEYCRSGFVYYNGRVLRFRYQQQEKDVLEKCLKETGLDYNFFQNDECEIAVGKPVKDNVVFFYNETAFLNGIADITIPRDDLIIVILKFEAGYLIKDKGEGFSGEKAIIFNTLSYREIIDLFSRNADFTSFHDVSERRLLILSGDKGPFFIHYNREEPKVKALPDLSLLIPELKASFEKIEFVKFFKDAVIDGIHRSQEDDRFFEMINSLRVLLDIAVRDYNIYLRQFGFEKIKAKFKEERIKYFEGIEKNIDSVSKQVTSFPLTFAASVFAAYQVKDKFFILWIILGAYSLYTIIAWKILNAVNYNRLKIEEDKNAEEQKIQTSYQLLYDDFKSDFVKVGEKLKKLKYLIIWLRVVLVALVLAFAAFCYYQQNYAKTTPISPIKVEIVK